MKETETKKNLTKKPVRFQLDMGYGQFIVSILVVIIFFILPIETISNWGTISSNIEKTYEKTFQPQPQVAGIFTDNTGRYYNIPIINFQFDTTLRDPATISFTFGLILIILSIVIVLLLFADFRKKEMKYR